jgi:hypothetical protein
MAKRSPIEEGRLSDPDVLRKKAEAYRLAATLETDPERRRACMVVASEYDVLADAIESAFGGRCDG